MAPKRMKSAGSAAKKLRTTTTTKKAPPKRYSKLLSTVNLGKGFPLKLQMTHRYIETIGLTCTSGVITNFRFSCNGMHDPNNTGVGHQPYYYDQLTAIYAHYTVLKSKLKLTCTPALSGSLPCAIVTYINDDTTSTPTDLDNAIEAQQGRYKIMPQGAGDAVVTYSYWDAVKIFGGDPMANDNLQGTSGANPPEQSFYNIVFGSLDKTNTVSCFITAEIEYTAMWDELRDIASS